MTRLLALVWPDLRAPDADTSPFGRMLDALDEVSPRVEAVDAGVALVDVTGLGPMLGTERRIAARAVMLVRGVAPLRVRCGIGDNRWLATLAARLARFGSDGSPAAFHALPPGPAASRAALRDLPLDLLPADPATRQRFALFGLTSMGQLADLPRSAVAAQFGAAGERLQALARGHDPRPIVARRRPERLVAATRFETPLDGIGTVGLALRRLAAELCDRLRERHLAPGRAVLTLGLEDAAPLCVAQPFPQPALEPDWIARLLLSRIEVAVRSRISRDSRAVTVTHQDARANLSKTMPTDSEAAGSSAFDPLTSHLASMPRESAGGDRETTEPRVVSVHLAFDRLADPQVRQLPAFEARAGRWEELRWSFERIRHRFGDGRLWRAVHERPAAALPEHRSRLVDIGSQ